MPNLYMLLIGCKPVGRHTEQHDIFFGIGDSLKDLLPTVKSFWPEAAGKMHLDGWRTVTVVDGYEIKIVNRDEATFNSEVKLFFINLGGYKKNELEEFHYKMIIAETNKTAAISEAKKSAFYLHTGFEGANSHIDDKYGVDVDDLYEIEDILPKEMKQAYKILVTPSDSVLASDELHLGYFKLSSFE